MAPRADITALDATAQLAALSSLRLSAVDLLRVSLARRGAAAALDIIAGEAVEPALERARAIDDGRKPGDGHGLLAGLPVTISEQLDADRLGTPARPGRDAIAVGKLRRAGAVVWAKTRREGKNPWLPDHPARGAHAAVAMGLTALELAVDRAGGLIREASHAGVFAHRPSSGLVLQRGADPPGFDHMAEMDLVGLGPVARSARDLRLAVSVLAEATIAHVAPPLELGGLKLGLWLKGDFPLDAEVKAALERFGAELSAAGAQVQAVRCPVDPAELAKTFAKLDKGARGAWMTHKAWMEADEARARLGAVAAKSFDGLEAIIAPAAAAPLGAAKGRRRALDPWPMLAVTLGLPVSVVPVAMSAAGAPIGAQLIGRHNADSRVLSLAQAIDERIAGYRPPPSD